jgi:hypothetical protein
MSTLPTDPQDTPLSYYVSLVSGALLTISEILPYLSQFKGNGIVHALTQAFTNRAQHEQVQDQALQQTQQALQLVLQRLDALEARLNTEK